MPEVHKELQRALSEAATCIANDDLTGARERFVRAINRIDVTVGKLSPLSTNAASTTATSSSSKKSGRKKTPTRRSRGNHRRG